MIINKNLQAYLTVAITILIFNNTTAQEGINNAQTTSITNEINALNIYNGDAWNKQNHIIYNQ